MAGECQANGRRMAGEYRVESGLEEEISSGSNNADRSAT
jgi:hypothetical protein